MAKAAQAKKVRRLPAEEDADEFESASGKEKLLGKRMARESRELRTHKD